MGLWWLMLVSALLIPLLMIVAGFLMEKRPPKKINGFLGYRTIRSMKNMDTWRFAHSYCGKLWWKTGLILLFLALGLQLAIIGQAEEVHTITGLVSMFVSMAALLVSALFTERALKENFTEDGQRK